MDIAREFPLRYYINLANREDRRNSTKLELLRAGIHAERFPAVSARATQHSSPSCGLKSHELIAGRLTRLVRGYEDESRYALALTQRLLIRKAKQQKAKAILILEDDVEFHPNFAKLVESIQLPDDWGIFYFGCAHVPLDGNELSLPMHSPMIARTQAALDTHAFAVNSKYYDQVLGCLDRHNKPIPDFPLASDQFLARLHRTVPTYSCLPNLAWQKEARSDIINLTYSNYGKSGEQLTAADPYEAAFARSYGSPLANGRRNTPRPAFLFLTRGDVNHPEIWRQFFREHESDVGIYAHSGVVPKRTGNLLGAYQIKQRFVTKWGDMTLVDASRALLQAALNTGDHTHFFLLSESCIPARPLRYILWELKQCSMSRFSYWNVAKATELQKFRASALPSIDPRCIYFHSQWWMFDRMTAEWALSLKPGELFSQIEIPDELYFATSLKLAGYPLERLALNKPITWVKWREDAGRPINFSGTTPLLISQIVRSGAWFARKFTRSANLRDYTLHL